MLVVLDAGASGDAEASSPALGNEGYRRDILRALNSGMGIVSLLVGSTRLEAYASGSKRGIPLWEAGLYDTIAIPAPEAVLLAVAEVTIDCTLLMAETNSPMVVLILSVSDFTVTVAVCGLLSRKYTSPVCALVTSTALVAASALALVVCSVKLVLDVTDT